ncbi:hypothetical protein M231_04771 [Tremella mesenterica]|uniref:USP domain-containing protein n=1 Tax=Tremella mesenterica TaxID=5217 RepID=A0A4Q1BJY0_TREME|nr:hypothetical protein M231_04771 [Tremella mesenterica]
MLISDRPPSFDQMLAASYYLNPEISVPLVCNWCESLDNPFGTVFPISNTYFGYCPPCLRLTIVWGISHPPSPNDGGVRVVVNNQFKIPIELSVPTTTFRGVDVLQYRLQSIVCRIGDRPDSGHYVAIVRRIYGDAWWIMDDDRVNLIEDPSAEAFQQGRYPVYIFYSKVYQHTPTGNLRRPVQVEPHSIASVAQGSDSRDANAGVSANHSVPDPPSHEDFPGIELIEDDSTATKAVHAGGGTPGAIVLQTSASPPSPKQPTEPSALATAASNLPSNVQPPPIKSGSTIGVKSAPKSKSRKRSKRAHVDGVQGSAGTGKLTTSKQVNPSEITKLPSLVPNDHNAQEAGPVEDRVVARYNTIPWRHTKYPGSPLFMSNAISLASPRQFRTPPTPLSSNFFDVLHQRATKTIPPGPGVDNGRILTIAPTARFDVSILKEFKDRHRWWNESLIHPLCHLGLKQACLQGHCWYNEVECRYVEGLFTWRDDPPTLQLRRKDPRPWPALGRDATWRTRITVSVVSVAFNTHFVTVAIFGPARLVIPYDSTGGAHDVEELSVLWPSLLEDRLDWELKNGLVTVEDNVGWIFAPNTTTLRDKIGWVKQLDSNNCGPLATAAALMIFESVKPTALLLGLTKPTYAFDGARLLQDCFFAMIVKGASSYVSQWSAEELSSLLLKFDDTWFLDKSVQTELLAWWAALDTYNNKDFP